MSAVEEALYLIRTRGWVKFESVLSTGQVQALAKDSEKVYDLRRTAQVKGGVTANMDGAAHHALGEGTSLDDFMNAMPLMDVIERHFDGKVILLNFGAAINAPGAQTYTHKIHRDIRAFTRDYPLSLNMLVMLDDFTLDNGATLVLEGSHHVEDMPDPDLFARHATALTGKAGDIVLFDSLMAHSAASNRSNGPRRCLTLCFGRPFMKPQMDWPRFLSQPYQAALSPTGRQLMGLDARVAASLEDYYQPRERWTFKADQI